MKETQNAKTKRKMKRVYLVDDHPLFREGLGAAIQQIPDTVVCGEASSAIRALEEIPQLLPDLVLLDITLNGKSGLELLQDLRAILPDLPILVVSMHDEQVYAERVIRLGARGYVMKDDSPEHLLEAVRTVLQGEVSLSKGASSMILAKLSGSYSGAKKTPYSSLTEREFEILRMIGEGRDGHEIARDLNLSLKTVDTHRGNLRKKLGLKNSTALIHHAVHWAASLP